MVGPPSLLSDGVLTGHRDYHAIGLCLLYVLPWEWVRSQHTTHFSVPRKTNGSKYDLRVNSQVVI